MGTPNQGYPDFARVNLAAGFLLYGAQVPYTTPKTVFQGYVGIYPYIDFWWSKFLGTDEYLVQFIWFADSTFSTSVASQLTVRDSNSQGAAQYAVLGPWLQINIQPNVGGDNNPAIVAIYGTTGRAPAGIQVSDDVPFFQYNTTQAAGTVTTPTKTIIPGPAILSYFSGAGTFSFSILSLNRNSFTYTEYWTIQQAQPASGSLLVALPDSPTKIQIFNGGAGALAFKCYLQSLRI